MIAALKSEMRKLLTVRSTYFVILLIIVIELIIGGYAQGYNLSSQEVANPLLLQGSMTGAIGLIGILISLVAILLVTHEYRYNTILYTLTSNKSRSVMFLSKVAVITVYSLVVTALVIVAAPLFTVIGASLGGLHLAPQIINYGDILWRLFFFGWGYSMLGLIIATLIRNQTGAFMIMFVAPTILLGILTVLFKSNAVYMPFSVLNAVLEKAPMLSYGQAAGIFLGYVAAGFIAARILLSRRNAN